jgi:lysyl-tRNA synthetase class 2
MALTDQEIVRREKLQKLVAKGIDPFGQKFITTHHSTEAKKLLKAKTTMN